MQREKIREVERMEGARRAIENPSMKREKEERLAISERVSNPEVSEKATRRKYTVRYKLRILEEADGCTQMGSLGGLLRREGLYHSNLNTWRRQREEGTLSALAPKKRGRKRAVCNPLQPEMDRLEKENEGLRNRLRKAEIIIDVQKKVSQILGIPLEGQEERESR